MRLDMKFGWRPQFNDRDLHRKEAIAIKLTYPNNQNLIQGSVRCTQLASELYRMNKSKFESIVIYKPLRSNKCLSSI